MDKTIAMAREAGLFTHKEVQREIKAFEALVRADEREQALAAPVQEPVAILNHAHGVYAFRSVNLQELPDGEYQIYTTPPAQPAPVQEPVAKDNSNYRFDPPEAEPAQRQWVGLTDEEIDDLYQGAGKNDLKRAREIEAKLKEKNT